MNAINKWFKEWKDRRIANSINLIQGVAYTRLDNIYVATKYHNIYALGDKVEIEWFERDLAKDRRLYKGMRIQTLGDYILELKHLAREYLEPSD